MSGSLFHGAITALHATFAPLATDAFTVTDGPEWNPGVLCLEVAWAGDDRDAVEVARRSNNVTLTGGIEAISVMCMLSNHDGSATVAAARSQLRDAFDDLVTLVEADPTLGGVVDSTTFGELRYAPSRTEGGATAALVFAVNITAFP